MNLMTIGWKYGKIEGGEGLNESYNRFNNSCVAYLLWNMVNTFSFIFESREHSTKAER